MAAEEVDEVVEEIDVYVTKSLAKSLYVFQYPVRPSSVTYDGITNLKAKVKPVQQKIELELPVSIMSSNYDYSKGEQIALNVDGRGETPNAFFESSVMDKQVLSSTRAVSSTSRYAIGLINNGELHLTPLHSIVQLRPSFSYLDKSDNRAKIEQNSKDDEEASHDEEEEEAKAVMVRFAKPGTDKAKLAKERSYNYIQKQINSEPWVNVSYHPILSSQSTKERALLATQKIEKMERGIVDCTAKDYLSTLIPQNVSCDIEVPDDTESSYSVNDAESSCSYNIQRLPPCKQVRAIMMNAKVLQFSQLLKLLSPGFDEGNVLRALQQVAMLVQGCWVIKSNELYPENSYSPVTGIGADLLCRARDYVMWCFTQSRILIRKDIMYVIKVSPNDLTFILSQMALKRPSKGWEFMQPYDQEFITRYPEVVLRQKMLWDVHYQKLSRMLQLGQMENKNSGANSSSETKPRSRRRTKSFRESVSDDTEGSGPDVGAGEKMDIEFARKKQSRSPYKSFRRLKESGNSVEFIGQKAHGSLPIATFEISPTPTHCYSSPELKSQLLSFVKEKLFSNHCLPLNEIKRLLAEKVAECPSGHVLHTEVSDKLLADAVIEVGGKKLQNRWPQNTVPEPLYAFTKFGDNHDRYRDVLIEVFTKTARTRIGHFQKKVEDELSESPSESVCKRLLEDYCIHKAGYYYLKGTLKPDS